MMEMNPQEMVTHYEIQVSELQRDLKELLDDFDSDDIRDDIDYLTCQLELIETELIYWRTMFARQDI